MLNRTEVIGHVGADGAKLGQTAKKGIATATFSVAVNEGKGENERTNWFKVTIYGPRAEALAPYIKKGQMVYLAGRAGAEGWLNKDNEVKTALTLIVGDGRNDFQFLGSGPREEELPDVPADEREELIPANA